MMNKDKESALIARLAGEADEPVTESELSSDEPETDEPSIGKFCPHCGVKLS